MARDPRDLWRRDDLGRHRAARAATRCGRRRQLGQAVEVDSRASRRRAPRFLSHAGGPRHTGRVDDMTRLRESVVSWAAGGADAAAAEELTRRARLDRRAADDRARRGCQRPRGARTARGASWPRPRRGGGLRRARWVGRPASADTSTCSARMAWASGSPDCATCSSWASSSAPSHGSGWGSRASSCCDRRPRGRVHPGPRRRRRSNGSSSSQGETARVRDLPASSRRRESAPTSAGCTGSWARIGGRKEQYGRRARRCARPRPGAAAARRPARCALTPLGKNGDMELPLAWSLAAASSPRSGTSSSGRRSCSASARTSARATRPASATTFLRVHTILIAISLALAVAVGVLGILTLA